MTSHLEPLDIFLNSKDVLLKDENFDMLDVSWTCMDDDKFLDAIRYGDRIEDTDSEPVDDPETSNSEVMYNVSEEALSPLSQSSGSSISENCFDDAQVVQLVGILPAGVKVILQDEPHETQHSYQELKLSDEERRLLNKEGIALPSHYPLTKFEERELKRIRRKIRNKISAQDSRKRKKEFLDTLQQRVNEVEEEKSFLSKKVRTLEAANAKLTAQVKRLQVAMSAAVKGPQTNPAVVPAATTLLVLILSLALVVLPTMQQGGKKMPPLNGMVGTFDDPNPNTSIAGRSRTMMPSAYDAWKDIDDEPLVKIPRFSFPEPAAGAKKVLTPIIRKMENVKAHVRPRVNQLLDDLE